MAKRVSWFCADSAMPHDPRLLSLPDNDYRWVFFCLLSLEKRGELDGQDAKDFFHYCHCTLQKFPMILELLHEKGLVDDSFRPVDFDGWQQSMLKSQRNKRSRVPSKNTRKRVASESQGSQEESLVSLSETETETETDKEEDSSCLTSGELTRKNEFSDEVKYIANILAQGMTDNDPKARLPKTDKQRDSWMDSIEKIHRLDGREWDVIESVARWCQQDDFWKSNIMSASKLRKQFPQLLAKMNSPEKTTGRFGNQEKLLKTMKEINDGELKEGTCWDSPCIQRADDDREGRRLLGGT